MAPLFGILQTILLASSSSSSPNTQTSSSSSSTSTTLIEVCLSPGCIADGAKETLSRLCAFAPPNVQVLPGKCVSACGAGPVVMKGTIENEKDNERKVVVHKRVAGDALLKLLLLEGGDDDDDKDDGSSDYNCGIPKQIIEGYEITIEADDAFKAKDYAKAAMLYRQGIDVALDIAMELHGPNNSNDSITTTTTTTTYSPGLEWLIRAHHLEAESRIQLREAEVALEIAKYGFKLSNNTNQPCLEVIARACQDLGDAIGELDALKTLLVEMEVEENAPRDVLNRRRELGFRLAKLEREAV